MDFVIEKSLPERKASGILVLPFWKGKKGSRPAGKFGELSVFFDQPIKQGDFSGKEGEILVLYTSGQPEHRLALLGLGPEEDLTVEKLRRAYSLVSRTLCQKKITTSSVVIPEVAGLSKSAVIRGAVEGLLLSNYEFNKLKVESKKKEEGALLQKITLIGVDKTALALVKKAATICECVHAARDLVNGNADDITPQFLASEAQRLSKQNKKIKTTVWDKKRIEKENLGLFLAVNRGSSLEPRFIILEYKGNPKSRDRSVIVGKGITFDTGGLDLKTADGMDTMRCDMAGAAVVLNVCRAVAELGLKVNLTGIIAATENSIGPQSYKPRDVYVGYAGKSVEIGNTDAEGRLVLADALAYAVKEMKPTWLIDVATLTGGVEVALGNEVTGLFSNHDVLADTLIRSGSETFERLWRFPLYEEYKEQLKSDVADIKSTGGRPASSIVAAMFLQEFVGNVPWAHLDIAGTAFLSNARRYHPKLATGIGVRLLVEFFEHVSLA